MLLNEFLKEHRKVEELEAMPSPAKANRRTYCGAAKSERTA